MVLCSDAEDGDELSPASAGRSAAVPPDDVIMGDEEGGVTKLAFVHAVFVAWLYSE